MKWAYAVVVLMVSPSVEAMDDKLVASRVVLMVPSWVEMTVDATDILLADE